MGELWPTWCFVVVREHQHVGYQVVRIEASHQQRPAICLKLRGLKSRSVCEPCGVD